MGWKEDRRAAYRKKLLDPRWQKKRLEILSRDDFACRACGAKDKTLHVHHIWYDNDNEPWDVVDTALATLCADCHEGETGFFRESGKYLIRDLNILGLFGNAFEELGLALHRLRVDGGIPKGASGDQVAIALSHALSDPDFIVRILAERREWEVGRDATTSNDTDDEVD